ncbi:MAG TPA: outer membrane lipoprotein carrier protein LolA [Candidatus Polarisedimenticolia bacterium]|nr:outer membrane lipoprotein carrier protein LolA [Candidatus Polarisedimenticolia bacterium]
MNKGFALVGCLLLCLGVSISRTQGQDVPALQLPDLLKRFNESQQSVASLTASFTERKNLNLLAKPLVSNGTFLYSRPSRIKWEYTEPEPRVFLITEDRFIAYYPNQKRAEEVPLSKLAGRRVFRVFGIGQTAEDLGKFFDISQDDPGDEKGAYLLILTPKRQRVKDRLQRVRFWVDAKTFLPRKLEYVESDGDSTLLSFNNIRLNPEIAEARFSVDIPKDVPVSNTFSGFSGSSLSR